jgi:Mg/Co/Ni transporter MgtE
MERLAILKETNRYHEKREALKAFVPADIADQINVLPIKEVVKILRVLPKDISAEVFSYFPIRFQKKVIALFTQSEIKSIIEELYADDAADLIDEMPANVVTKILFKEMRISLLVGFVLSFVNFFRIWLTYEFDVLLSLTVSLTLVVVIFAAKTIGSMLPLLAKKLNLDPALMAAPFITTLVDASALITYFLIASTLLGTAS